MMRGHELAMALRSAYLAMHRRTDAVMARYGVTADQFVVLAALAEREAMTQRDLVARTSSDPNTLRQMLVLLERRGLIERRPNPTDRRARSVALTRKGRSAYQTLWRRSAALRDRLLAAVAPDDAAQFIAQLQRIVAALAKQTYFAHDRKT
jgi:DNA-binding MarR family transcriptional regulator